MVPGETEKVLKDVVSGNVKPYLKSDRSVMLKKGEIKTENSAFIQFGSLHNISYILFKWWPVKAGECRLMCIAQKSWSNFVWHQIAQKQTAWNIV